MSRWRPSLSVSPRDQPTSAHSAVRQRLGGDHQRVQRQERAALTAQRRRVRLGGADHVTCSNGALRGDRAVRQHLEHGGLLGDRARRPVPPRGPGRAPAWRGGSARSWGCTPPRGSRVTRTCAAASAASSHVSARSASSRCCDRATCGAQLHLLHRRPGHGELAAAEHVGVDAPRARAWRRRRRCPSTMARCMALAAARPHRRSSRSHVTGKRSLHQPPLRPLAPKPAISRSRSRTFSAGSWRSRAYAVHRPVKPAPTMATSTSRSPSSGGRGVRSSSTVSSQRLSRRYRSCDRRGHASMFDITCLMRV